MKNEPEELPDYKEIDLSRLEWEWVQQPRLFERAARKLADAKRDLETTKVEVELVKAEVELDVRNHPKNHGLIKVTEKSIAAAVVLSDEYRSALQTQNRAKYRVDIFQVRVTTLEHKKKALENVVDLYGQQYFSKPKASDKANRELDQEHRRNQFRRERKEE